MGRSPSLRRLLFYSQTACKCRSKTLFRSIKVPVRSNNRGCYAGLNKLEICGVFEDQRADTVLAGALFSG